MILPSNPARGCRRSWPRNRDRASDLAPMACNRHRAEFRDVRDPETAQFITAGSQTGHHEIVGWRNAAVMAGHWALYGFGMFAVEEKSSGCYVGRVGPWCPPGWPGVEVGWGIAKEFRGKGYAVEAARASIDWAFDNCWSTTSSTASKPKAPRNRWPAARRAEGRETELFGQPVDLWITTRGVEATKLKSMSQPTMFVDIGPSDQRCC